MSDRDPGPMVKLCTRCGAHFGAAAEFCQKDGTRLLALSAREDPFVGRVLLDQFRLEEAIGAGGMGTVYRARQLNLGRDVAVKVLHSDLLGNPDAVHRFQREARVATALDHPNVVRVFLLGELEEGNHYLVMEHVSGRSLGRILDEEGPLPLPRALGLLLQICDGVGEAHLKGIVHRDVKPENVLVVERSGGGERVKVLDFGIARVLNDEHTMMTQSGVIFGTARYISPEGAQGDATDARSDVYSIGVLAYQMLAGETPFDAPTPVGLLMKHIHAPPPNLVRHASVPAPLGDAVMETLAKNPRKRPPDARALAVRLREAAHRAGVMPGPVALVPAPDVAGTPGALAGDEPVAVRSRGVPTEALGSPIDPRPDSLSHPSRMTLLTRRARAAWVALGLLSALGAGIGAFFLLEPSSEVPSLDDLGVRARAALSRGDLDAPPGENVAELTERMLTQSPAHAPALALRAEAARRLLARAADAEVRGNSAAARALYRRALVFRPADSALQEALRRLGAPKEPPREVGVRVVPESPETGESVMLAAVVKNSDANLRAPRFVLTRGGRRLPGGVRASPGGDSGRYVASYRFRWPGRYEVRFEADGLSESLALEVRVERKRTAERPRPPTVTLKPAADPASGTVIPTWPASGAVTESPDEAASDSSAKPAAEGSRQLAPESEPESEPAEPAPETETPEPPAPWTGTLL